MRQLMMSRVFTLIEPGPVVLVTTYDGNKNNIMTVSWTMVLDFTPMFAITTGRVELFLRGLTKDEGVCDRFGIGTCSGADTDKFAKFKLTAMPGMLVKAPLIKECLANIECKVIDLIEKHNIVVLQAVAAYEDPARKEKRTVHAVGDGTFIVDGRRLDRSAMMASKLPAGL